MRTGRILGDGTTAQGQVKFRTLVGGLSNIQGDGSAGGQAALVGGGEGQG